MIRSIIILLILSLASSAVVYAESAGASRSKIGFELKGIRTLHDDEIGWLTGLRYGRFFGTSQFYLGLAGYYGVPRGTNPSKDSMAYGGLTLGVEGKLGRETRFELGLTLGYGEGKLTSVGPITEKSYFVIEPSLSAGFNLGEGWRLYASASYLFMNEADRFNGVTAGLRFEYKFQTTSKPLKD